MSLNSKTNNNDDSKTYDVFSEMPEKQIILNICFNNETGRLVLSDNYNNHYLCDMFGRIKTKFFPNVTGTVNYKERRKKLLSAKQTRARNIFKSVAQSSRPCTSKQKKEDINYHPTTRKFEGYSKFPRPLSSTFTNIPSFEMKDNIKKELVNDLKQYFSDTKNKLFFEKTGDNIGLSYLTQDLNEFDHIKEDIQKLILIINNTLDNIKEGYKNKLNLFYKLPVVKALTKFEKFLSLNKDVTVINGRKLQQPNQQIVKKYNSIQNVISSAGIKTNKNKYHSVTSSSTRNNKNQMKRRDLILASFNYKNKVIKAKDLEKNKDCFNLYFKGNDMTIGRFLKMDFGNFLYEDQTKPVLNINSELTKKQKNNSSFDFSKISKLKTPKHTEKIVGNTDFTKFTEESVKEKNEGTNNISFISNMSENEKKYESVNIINVKSNKILKADFEKEQKLLEGYKNKEKRKPYFLQKTNKPKFKSNGELYDHNMDILRKTNPIAFKLQKEKEDFDLKQLQRKVNMFKINSNNVMKGKVFQQKRRDSVI